MGRFISIRFKMIVIVSYFIISWMSTLHYSIQDFDTIVSSKISLEMESLKICKESLISMEIDTFDRLRSGLNIFPEEEMSP